MYKIFIDGSAGTTGLEIRERLATRKDIEIITLPEELRKDVSARKQAINSADLVFLCLPDDASRESVSLIESDAVKVIDTSTAFRTSDDWTYGFAEIGYKDEIKTSKRVANPGCHASGFVALVKPLVDAKIIKDDALLTCFSLTGYSGGGKKMIADYEDENRSTLLDAPRQYGLTQKHKHLPEMQKVTGLKNAPVFCPIVADFKRGMQVTVPLFSSQINGTVNDIKSVYKKVYNGKIVAYTEDSENSLISANSMANKDSMQISVYGNEDRILLVARFDNLGKGASGSAIQNMNLLLGTDETVGLEL